MYIIRAKELFIIKEIEIEGNLEEFYFINNLSIDEYNDLLNYVIRNKDLALEKGDEEIIEINREIIRRDMWMSCNRVFLE